MTEDGKPVAHDDRPQRDEGTPQGTPEQAAQPTQPEPAAEEGRGRIRYQDPEHTTPREPTLAEQRARIAAEKRRDEQHQAELEAAARKTQKRRRIMIGGGATVGVVALVAAMYSASEISNEANAVTQYCASDQGGQPVAANDQNCDENYVRSHGGYIDHGSGFVFMPLFLGGPPVPQYRYAYTAPGSPAPAVGSPATGSTFAKPSDSTIKSKTGSTIQRGGFGINSKSGSGGS
ncbi:hypothetical protein [Saccharopolyspora phatthalungensis]|uniref:Cell pole-organizing protein PopZ n=1 Tax=Saccharopolyspora phatthalungensis TaxID=664693 RepID=A0A840Q3I2_9PSEU|nr:hypothetical protein [Saccharopolyspora phatthalungensis]MBB5154171.1 cell pole-organizing protein PopZ [Saccharopolyspora phatthalungensis]